MSFPDLHEFVQGQFAEFMGYEEHETQLTIWAYRQRAEKTASDREWQARNRMKVRSYHREWLSRKTETICRQCSEPAIAGKRLCAPHLARAVSYQQKSQRLTGKRPNAGRGHEARTKHAERRAS